MKGKDMLFTAAWMSVVFGIATGLQLIFIPMSHPVPLGISWIAFCCWHGMLLHGWMRGPHDKP